MSRNSVSSGTLPQDLLIQVPSEQEGKRTLRAPTFFVSQEDHSFKTEFFPSQSEAERRISFFAQSLSTPIPEPLPVDNMPTFTVLIPHYSEKILLSLREIIREDEPYLPCHPSRVSQATAPSRMGLFRQGHQRFLPMRRRNSTVITKRARRILPRARLTTFHFTALVSNPPLPSILSALVSGHLFAPRPSTAPSLVS